MTAATAPAATGSLPARRAAASPPPSAYVQAVLCAGGSVLTVLLYRSCFAAGDWLPRLAALAVAGAGTGFATSVRPLRRVTAALTGVAVLAVCAVYAVLGSTLRAGLPGAATVRTAGPALAGGWESLLTVGTPAAASARLLMAPAVVTFAAAFLAVSAALRSRAVLAPAAALLPAELIGLLYAAARPGAHLGQAALLLTVLLLLALVRAAPATAPGSDRRAAETAARCAAALLVVAVAVPAAAVLPSLRHDRFDPRTLVPRHLRLLPTGNPLSEVRAEVRRKPATALFTLSLRGAGAAARVDRVRTAVLDTFDGAQWTASGSYLVAGPTLAPGPDPLGATSVTEHVVVDGLRGPFLPTAGGPTQVRTGSLPGGRLGFDARSGTLVTDAPTLEGARLTLTGVLPPPAPASALLHARVGAGRDFAAYTAQPALPAPLAALADRLTAGATTPYAELVGLASYLRHQPYSSDAPSGVAYGTLVRMLTSGGGRDAEGGGEQHAAAFAVLARFLGMPTRIAVGYLLPAARHGIMTVSSADAYAWPQVYFTGFGWVDFDPTDVSALTHPPAAASDPAAAPPPAATRITPPTVAPARPSAGPLAAAHPAGHGPPTAVVAGLLAALLVAAAGANVTAKQVRRRRRRLRGGPSRRVAAAWLEATDRLTEAGTRVPPALTAQEFAAAAATADPATGAGRALRRAAPTLGELAVLTGYALFAPDPSRPSDAARAWRLEQRLRTELYPRRRTALRLLHRLKPLRPHRSRRPAPHRGGPA